MAQVRLDIIFRAVDQARGIMRDIGDQSADLTARYTKLGLAAGAAGAAILGSMGLAIKQVTDFGGQLYDMAQKTSLSVETLSQLGYVAETAGGSLESLATAAVMMQRTAVTSGEKFAQVGVNVKGAGGQFKGANELFWETITALRGMTDPTLRAGMAMQLFGRGGKELLPILNMTSSEFDELTKTAKSSAQWTEAQAKAADDWGDTLLTLKRAMGGLVRDALLPMIETLTPYVVKVAQVVSVVSGWVRQHPTLAKAIGFVVLGLGALLSVAGSVLLVLGQIAPLISLVMGMGGLGGLAGIAGEAAAALGGIGAAIMGTILPAIMAALPYLAAIAIAIGAIIAAYKVYTWTRDAFAKQKQMAQDRTSKEVKWAEEHGYGDKMKWEMEHPTAGDSFMPYATLGATTAPQAAALRTYRSLRNQERAAQGLAPIAYTDRSVHLHGPVYGWDDFKAKVAEANGALFGELRLGTVA